MIIVIVKVADIDNKSISVVDPLGALEDDAQFHERVKLSKEQTQ